MARSAGSGDHVLWQLGGVSDIPQNRYAHLDGSAATEQRRCDMGIAIGHLSGTVFESETILFKLNQHIYITNLFSTPKTTSIAAFGRAPLSMPSKAPR